ncbi:MAG: hypothetical protein ABSH14_08620 [Verrucomicrobiia bacterium]|jgi:hypothetical protein
MSNVDLLHVVWGIVASLGGGAVIVFALSNWIGKVWADRLMASEKAKHDAALELLRADIRKAAFESEIRFSKLHEKRAEVIADLYSKLVEFVAAAEQFLYGGASIDPEKHRLYVERQKEFYDTFNRNRIYFPTALCNALSDFIAELHRLTSEKYILGDYRPMTPEESKDWRTTLLDRWKAITVEVPKLKEQLTEEFRRLLGSGNQ